MTPGNREIVERYLKDYNDKDIEAMLAHFADDAKFESVSNTSGVVRTSDKKGLRDLASQSAEFFEARRLTALGWVVEGDRIAIEVEFWCRISKDLPGGSKAGQEMTLRGATFFTFKNGRITQLVDYM